MFAVEDCLLHKVFPDISSKYIVAAQITISAFRWACAYKLSKRNITLNFRTCANLFL